MNIHNIDNAKNIMLSIVELPAQILHV